MEVEDYPNYLIYEDGSVYTKPRHRVKGGLLRQQLNKQGYYKVGLWKDNKSKSFFVHRLVALNYIPNPHNYPEVDHIDRDPRNNHLYNLRWCDRQMNNDKKDYNEYGVRKTNKLR